VLHTYHKFKPRHKKKKATGIAIFHTQTHGESAMQVAKKGR